MKLYCAARGATPVHSLPPAAVGRKWPRSTPFKAVEDVQTNYNLFLDRLGECERHINANYEVEKLCKVAVVRLEKLRDKKGARMSF